MFLRWGRLHTGPCWGKSLSRGHGGSHPWGMEKKKKPATSRFSLWKRTNQSSVLPFSTGASALTENNLPPIGESRKCFHIEPEALNKTVLLQVRPWHCLALIIAQKKEPSLVNCFVAVGVIIQSYLLDLLLNLFSSLVMCPRTSDLQHNVGGAAPILPQKGHED